MGVRWGLRGKSALALLTACLVALVPALLIGWLAVDAVRQQFSQAYAENFTLLQMQRILAPISRELALAERFAQSSVTRDWLADEQDPAKRQRFFNEAESYRQGFAAHTYFAVVNASGDYYFSSDDEPTDRQPRYRLSADDPDDNWYSHLITSDQSYTLNVNIDRELKEAKVWINVVIRDDGRPLGIAGTGLDLSRFLDAFIRTRAHGITPMIVNRQGALLAYPDASRIAFNAQADNGDLARGQQLATFLGDEDERAELNEVIQRAVADPDDVYMLTAHLDGQPRLLSVGYVPSSTG
ncbi:cache domain-containing protein [Salinicola acroporae]|uniref:cache domain-containing protein n=1 Tax=Salinicola acroporae TaxID=1541440 RepID=UPI002454D305|nr:cache domain-containing protein [Salinicola acroporae]